MTALDSRRTHIACCAHMRELRSYMWMCLLWMMAACIASYGIVSDHIRHNGVLCARWKIRVFVPRGQWSFLLYRCCVYWQMCYLHIKPYIACVR